jgi:hypothetical protein
LCLFHLFSASYNHIYISILMIPSNLILKSQTFNAFILMFVNHFLLFQALSQQ